MPTAARTPQTAAPVGHWGSVSPGSAGSTQPYEHPSPGQAAAALEERKEPFQCDQRPGGGRTQFLPA